MAGQKYIAATADNPLQIAVRNILNPAGYVFLGHCSDPISLLRMVRSYSPDFIVVDINLQIRDLRTTIETIDDEMLCACIAIGDYKNIDVGNLIENSRVILFCPKPINKEILLHTVEMSIINFKRVSEINKKLQEVTENFETRKLIERAKWILIQRDGITENEAYERMRKKSMDSRLPMRAIADAIIIAHELQSKKQI